MPVWAFIWVSLVAVKLLTLVVKQMPHVDIYRNGKKLVSVTELTTIINKPFLEKWKEGLCNPNESICGFSKARQVAEEAADLGNEVHEQFAMWLSGSPLAEVSPWFLKLREKAEELQLRKYLIEPETTLKDEESNLAGSPDFVGRTAEVIKQGEMAHQDFIGDLKIKNSLDVLTGMQGAGYRYLLKRKHRVDINTMLILWAQKKSKNMTVKPVLIDLDKWVEPWKHLVGMWNVLNPGRKVNILE